MAFHYPADINIFALVRIEAEYCRPKDQSLVKYVSDKIGMDFIATAESDKTLYVVRNLEQLIGREIKWVTEIMTAKRYIHQIVTTTDRNVTTAETVYTNSESHKNSFKMYLSFMKNVQYEIIDRETNQITIVGQSK
jgi:hypothetical protein